MTRFVSAVMGKGGQVEAERAQKTPVLTDPIVRTEKKNVRQPLFEFRFWKLID